MKIFIKNSNPTRTKSRLVQWRNQSTCHQNDTASSSLICPCLITKNSNGHKSLSSILILPVPSSGLIMSGSASDPVQLWTISVGVSHVILYNTVLRALALCPSSCKIFREHSVQCYLYRWNFSHKSVFLETNKCY